MKPRWYVRAALSLVFAGLFGWFGWHFREYGLKLGWEPQTLFAADLVANGPGDNLKVRLRDYTIGEPLVEMLKDTVGDAWFPVYLGKPAKAGKVKEVPPIFYHRAAGDTRAAFEALRQHPVVQGVVANDLHPWPDEPTKALLQAYPGLDKARVIYLRDSSIPLQYLVYVAWTFAGVLAVIAGYYLVQALRGVHPAVPEGAPAQAGSRRTSTDLVPVYRAPAGTIPPEIEALGPPDSIHKPGWVYTIGKEKPVPVVLAGVLVLGLALSLFAVLPLAGNAILASGVALVGLVGLGLVALPFMTFDYAQTYVVYPDALVVIEGDSFIVIRWDAIVELNAPRTVVTADGQKFGLATMNEVKDLGRLYERVREEIAQRLLPPALAELDAGGTLAFGPFTVSRYAIGCNGTELPWERVAKLNILANVSPWGGAASIRQFTVTEPGLRFGPTFREDLNRIPNDWLFLEIVRRACPPRLQVLVNR
jgi:hypothetical protein